MNDLQALADFIANPDKYVYPFVIHEKYKDRTIITYNKGDDFGVRLRRAHELLINSLRDNFWDRSEHSFAYHKGIRCVDALDEHLRSKHFIKLDIHHFFESITVEGFLALHGNRFNKKWKSLLPSFFYKGSLSIGFVSSPLISDFFMSQFDEAIGEYIQANPFLHYSRYSDDILLSSEEEGDSTLLELFDFVKRQLEIVIIICDCEKI